jgi:hypothetical protein
MRRTSLLRLAGSLCAGGVIFAAFLHPAFAARTQRGGAAAAGVSGYVVSNVRYQLSATKIDRLAGVSFQLDKPAGTVRAGLAGSWAECSVRGTTATCTFADEPSIDDLNSLEVVASS